MKKAPPKVEKKKTEQKGPRAPEEVPIAELEEIGRQIIAQGTRLIANLESVRKVSSLSTLDVKNLPSLDQAFDKLTSFLGAVEKAASRAILRGPVRKEIDSAWATYNAGKKKRTRDTP